MLTLGINAAFHDPAACLVRDGKIIAAAEEERFTHVKHGKRPTPFTAYELPFHAINYCLEEADAILTDLDHIAYSFDPLSLLGKFSNDATITLPLEPSAHPTHSEWISNWDPLFLSSIVNAPRHLLGGVPHHLAKRFSADFREQKAVWHFVPHHLAHAASAFYPSPFEEAAILTLDGRGEKATTTYGMGKGASMELIGQVDYPHSLGLLYEKVTSYLGFLHSSDEYKVMALASFGKPRFIDDFRALIQYGDAGQYTISDSPLARMFGTQRSRGEPLDEKHFDIARSLQQVLEETVMHICDWLHRKTRSDNLVLAGGVALNCVLNSKIRDFSPFKNIWVQPAAGDAGTALGAALWIDVKERNSKAKSEPMGHAYYGPSYSDGQIEDLLVWTKTPYRKLADVAHEGADLLAREMIIGWYQGRMEFGPRALGARSILASPRSAEMQQRLNEIKDREDFRPVAPAVLADKASEWFQGANSSPFMLFVYDVRPDKADLIPAVRHVDGTARIQTVTRDTNPLYHDLIDQFAAKTGVPVLINTSFNIRGEPIVCTPRDALQAFWSSPLDALIIGSYLVQKGALDGC